MKKVIQILILLLMVLAAVIAWQPALACNNHAYLLCSGNSIFWFDSCGNQQDLYQNCSYSNLLCQYGRCVAQLVLPQPEKPQQVYNPYYAKKCLGNGIYWYDNLGAKTELFKNCEDLNSCTIDACASAKCSNTLKCDGSTCRTDSQDYQKYCAQSQPQGQQSGSGNISLSFFAKQDPGEQQWQKSAAVGPEGSVYFMIGVANNGSSALNNINVSANIPVEITSLGELKVNGSAMPGDIVSGINIGSLAPGDAKSITFEGRTSQISGQSVKQGTATVSATGISKSDTLDIEFKPGQPAPAAASQAASTGFLAFLKRWYLWILVGMVLVFLFVVIFRRLSSSS